MGTTLVLTGVACIVGAIIGGGVKLLQVEFRVVESLWRQYLLAGFGVILVIAGLAIDGNLRLAPSSTTELNTVADVNSTQPTVTRPQTPALSDVAQPTNVAAAAHSEQSSARAETVTAAPSNVPALSVENLKTALRFEVGDSSGSAVDGSDVRHVRIWLELPEAQREIIRSVRYEFNNPTFKSPKYAERGSPTFTARWLGYGCIDDAAVVAETTFGHVVRAPFNLCTLWNEGHL